MTQCPGGCKLSLPSFPSRLVKVPAFPCPISQTGISETLVLCSFSQSDCGQERTLLSSIQKVPFHCPRIPRLRPCLYKDNGTWVGATALPAVPEVMAVKSYCARDSRKLWAPCIFPLSQVCNFRLKAEELHRTNQKPSAKARTSSGSHGAMQSFSLVALRETRCHGGRGTMS